MNYSQIVKLIGKDKWDDFYASMKGKICTIYANKEINFPEKHVNKFIKSLNKEVK